MNYKETIDYLYAATPSFHNQGASAYKEGLENTLELDKHFGHPHQRYRTIHVAGTNGKGSTSCMLAAYLQKLGYKVGLYTSPHIYDFRERIRVNGNMISEEFVVGFVENNKDFFEPLKPSFFEITTAMAFLYFAEQQVDIAVIEVGLGGRLDCTNIIRPILSVITNIDYDHTNLLGSTLTEIAREKAGIIKRSVPVVIGESNENTAPVFAMMASQENAPMYISTIIAPDGLNEYIDACELKGDYQKQNIQTAMTAIEVLEEQGIKTDYSAFKEALKEISTLTGLMGRWQIVADTPKTIIDTGHNAAGWQFVSAQLEKERQLAVENNPKSVLRIVFGMVDDKDIDSVMKLLPLNARYYFTQADNHRAIPAKKIQQIAYAYGLRGNAFPKAQQAYEAAKKDADECDIVFIGGSNYVVGEIQIS